MQVRGEREGLREEASLPPLTGSSGQGQRGGPPSTGGTGHTSREKRMMAGKLDIRDLPWEDREKVRVARAPGRAAPEGCGVGRSV